MTPEINTSHLFPISNYQSAFTTSAIIAKALPGVVYVPLENERSLGVHKISQRTTRSLVQPPLPTSPESDASRDDHPSSENPLWSSPALPPPDTAWEAFYPRGSINPKAKIPGGFGLYLSGPTAFSERVKSATEVVFSYRVMMQDGWDWVKGGKLPGVCPSSLAPDLNRPLYI